MNKMNEKEENRKNPKTISQEDIMSLLDSCYDKCLHGVPKVSQSVEDLAEDYLKKYDTREDACRAMLNNQIIKCTTSGFITGFGGIQTQTFVYACLAGVAVNELIKQAGIKFGVKFANGLIKKIPGKVLTKINQKVGFRFITKFGTKGIINLGKMLPGVGAIVGGGLDLVETKVIAERAYKWFMTGDFSEDGKQKEEDVIELEDSDFDEVEPEECFKTDEQYED